jgi:hypothetical protein
MTRFCDAEKGGPVAQWLELTAHNRLVAGSSPAGPTTFHKTRLTSLRQYGGCIDSIGLG